MQDAGANTMEIHLPERWAVLELALRQHCTESGADYPGDCLNDADADETDAARRHPMR